MTAPLPFRWTGEAFEPLPRFKAACDRELVVGQVYRIETIEERSARSHAHYFACIHERWLSLPEHFGDRFPTPEHLRKYALIRAGFRDERTIVASSRAEALRLAAFVKPMDPYAIVTVTEALVTVWTAQSQSMKAMGREAFQKSKDDVLGVLDDMLGIKEEAA